MQLSQGSPAHGAGHHRSLLAIGLPLLLVSWVLLWTQRGFWNPLFFTGIWMGAILVMYAAGKGYPGPRRHAFLLALSIPLWWWFEIVNARVGNWEYLGIITYPPWQYLLLASLAFSTVVPALDASWGVMGRFFKPTPARPVSRSRRSYLIQVGAGVAIQAGVFALPDLLFPLVWVAPAVILDGLVGFLGGRSLVDDLARGEWRLAAQLAAGGLLCGFLWEFWNFWAMPKWTYHVAYLDLLRLFEMPLAGYAGYIPFAWSVYHLVALVSSQSPGPARRGSRGESVGERAEV